MMMQVGTPCYDTILTNPGGNVTTATTVTAPVPQTSQPTGGGGAVTTGVSNRNNDGMISVGHGGEGSMNSSAIKLWFYGVGSNGNTFIASVYGWEVIQNPVVYGASLWFPHVLCSFSAITLDTAFPGLANEPVNASNFFASAITLNIGNQGVDVDVVSPGNGIGIAHAVIDTKGCKFIEVRYAVVNATSANSVYRKM